MLAADQADVAPRKQSKVNESLRRPDQAGDSTMNRTSHPPEQIIRKL